VWCSSVLRELVNVVRKEMCDCASKWYARECVSEVR